MTVALLAACALAAVCWGGALARPSRPWDLHPRDDGSPPPDPPAWPAVAAVVPARNEAGTLPRTLPALLGQDYPGELTVTVVDDRSADGTAATARALGARAVAGAPLPPGWVGKVWALAQGVRASDPRASLVLLTDADILHGPDSLRRLVAEAEAGGLALVSRMARLRCEAPAERLLIPPFLLFFNLMYPMRLANRPGRRRAAAAGGCMLVRRAALDGAGGLEAIRGALIDDLALARLVAGAGGRTRLALSEGRVRSLRAYPRVADVWRMVARSAFTQLRRSWALVAAVVALMAVLFAAPPAGLVVGAAQAAGGRAVGWALLACAVAALAALAILARPALRHLDLPWAWAAALPVAGLLFAAMTVDSALRDRAGRAAGWRDGA